MAGDPVLQPVPGVPGPPVATAVAASPRRQVVGFLMCPETRRVVLIEKHRPVWMEGLLCGVGGSVEPGERWLHAMAREWQEETGLPLDIRRWSPYCRYLSDHDTDMMFFGALAMPGELFAVRSMTDEPVGVYDLNALPPNLVPNLAFLIPMAWHHLVVGKVDTEIHER